MTGEPRRFKLVRHEDESGMSGTGKVAEGVQLPNSTCVMWWLVEPYSVQIYRDIGELEHVHGHGDRETTEVVWLD